MIYYYIIRSYTNKQCSKFPKTIVRGGKTMANKFFTVSDETFTLSESENKNQFYFYRNDGEVLTDIDRELMDLYNA